MKNKQAFDLLAYIDKSKIKKEDSFFIQTIESYVRRGFDLDQRESKQLQEIYRYASGGGDKQDQPFKQYRRKTSWGVK